jgi:hypothetical protein
MRQLCARISVTGIRNKMRMIERERERERTQVIETKVEFGGLLGQGLSPSSQLSF